MKLTPHEQLAAIAGLNFADCVRYFAAQRSAQELRIVAFAQEQDREGTLEVDDEAIVSEGEDNGAYVMGWIWVDFAGTKFDKEEIVHLEATDSASGEALCGAAGASLNSQLAEIGANAVEPTINDPEAGMALCEDCLTAWRTQQQEQR